MGAVLLSPLYILLNLYLISRMLLWLSLIHISSVPRLALLLLCTFQFYVTAVSCFPYSK